MTIYTATIAVSVLLFIAIGSYAGRGSLFATLQRRLIQAARPV